MRNVRRTTTLHGRILPRFKVYPRQCVHDATTSAATCFVDKESRTRKASEAVVVAGIKRNRVIGGTNGTARVYLRAFLPATWWFKRPTLACAHARCVADAHWRWGLRQRGLPRQRTSRQKIPARRVLVVLDGNAWAA